MAITDDQLDELLSIARRLGKEDARRSIRMDGRGILLTVFDYGVDAGIRTDDEFNAEISVDDLPAPEDHRDLIAAYADGWNRQVQSREVQS